MRSKNTRLFTCDICQIETDNEVTILNHRKKGCLSGDGFGRVHYIGSGEMREIRND